jgi:hypothetical protein
MIKAVQRCVFLDYPFPTYVPITLTKKWRIKRHGNYISLYVQKRLFYILTLWLHESDVELIDETTNTCTTS